MKKLLTFALTLSIAASTLSFAENLKEKVCVVREQFSDSSKKWIKKNAEYLRQQGFSKESKFMEKIDGNTFGSGFVYVAPDGTNYIVTNRHVVSSCEKASVQFEQEDGSYKTYNNLKVLASDRDLDLALLSFPKGENPFASGMTVSSRAVSDGEEVWSAGFPGLGAEPSWQLGKGTVTNATTRIKALVDPEVSTLIQHSAPVDSGNSGGPLLRKNASGSYEVVGVNTWKVSFRQSTNISMPVSSLKKFIEKATSAPAPQSLDKRISAFTKELKEDEVSCSKIEKFLSKKYVGKSGAETFAYVMRNSSTADYAYTSASFAEYPLSGFYAALAVDIKNTLTKDDFAKNCKIVKPQQLDDGSYSVELINGKTIYYTLWSQQAEAEGSSWCIDSIGEGKYSESDELKEKQAAEAKKAKNNSKDSKKADSKKKIASENEFDEEVELSSPKKSFSSDLVFELPYEITVSGGLMNAPSDKLSPGARLTYSFISWLSVLVQVDSIKTGDDSNLMASGGLKLNVPINYNSFYIIPYALAGLNMGLLSTDLGLGYFAGAGLEVGYHFEVFGIFAFAEFTKQTIKTHYDWEDETIEKTRPSIGIGLSF